jgi:hypothetical protein
MPVVADVPLPELDCVEADVGGGGEIFGADVVDAQREEGRSVDEEGIVLVDDRLGEARREDLESGLRPGAQAALRQLRAQDVAAGGQIRRQREGNPHLDGNGVGRTRHLRRENLVAGAVVDRQGDRRVGDVIPGSGRKRNLDVDVVRAALGGEKAAIGVGRDGQQRRQRGGAAEERLATRRRV